MTTITDVFNAGVAAVIADNALNKSGFADALRTVATNNVSDADAKLFIDELAAEYQRLGIINNSTYASLRNELINEGASVADNLFTALAASVNALAASTPINVSVRKTDLRDERDQVDTNIDIIVNLKTGQPRQVKDALQLGIDQLRVYKQSVVTELQSLG